MPDPYFAGWPGRVAIAVTSGETPRVILAESPEVLSRAIALQWVARTAPKDIAPAWRESIRRALLEENWSDAAFFWMQGVGESVDAYPDETLWTDDLLDADRASMEIRMSAIFRDEDGEA